MKQFSGVLGISGVGLLKKNDNVYLVDAGESFRQKCIEEVGVSSVAYLSGVCLLPFLQRFCGRRGYVLFFFF